MMNKIMDFLNSEYEGVVLYHTSEFEDELYFEGFLEGDSMNIKAVEVELDNGSTLWEITQYNHRTGHRNYVGDVE